jgi:hypothetical protein
VYQRVCVPKGGIWRKKRCLGDVFGPASIAACLRRGCGPAILHQAAFPVGPFSGKPNVAERTRSTRCPSSPFANPLAWPQGQAAAVQGFLMDSDSIKRRIVELQIEHRDLDEAIERLAKQAGVDELALRRMKKRKLQIKDAIVHLQMHLVPDIPA